MNLQLTVGAVFSLVVLASFVNTVIAPEPLNAYTITYEIIPNASTNSKMGDEQASLPGFKLNDKELECLAKNVYFESRGEPIIGQKAVAWVTLNRAQSDDYSTNVCEVVMQSKQFSWTLQKYQDIDDLAAWDIAMSVAKDVAESYYVDDDPTEGAMFFHNKRKTPFWAESYEKTVLIDNHIFYR